MTEIAPAMEISFTRQVVDFDAGQDVRPGPWSPDGSSMVAFVVVRESSTLGPVGHLWTVDTDAGRSLWDSGDLEGPVQGAMMADWLPDGTLVLARQDGTIVSSDGQRVAEVSGLEGQPQEVSVSPDGRTVFVNGPDDSWLVDSSAAARQVTGRPDRGFASWSWRGDSGALALSVTGGEFFVIDVESATAQKFAAAPSISGGRMPPPRWLVDGRVFLSGATRLTYEGAPAFEHRVVDPETTRAEPLHALIGIPPNRWLPLDGSAWVSPDGAYVIHPEYSLPEGGAGEAVLWASWLYDVRGGQARRIDPVTDPVWAPDSERSAYRKETGLAVWHVESDTSVALSDGEAQVVQYTWSPDGRWILFSDGEGALWITSGDGRAGPTRVADHVVWEPGPTWSPVGDRFAATIGTNDEAPRLALVTVE